MITSWNSSQQEKAASQVCQKAAQIRHKSKCDFLRTDQMHLSFITSDFICLDWLVPQLNSHFGSFHAHKLWSKMGFQPSIHQHLIWYRLFSGSDYAFLFSLKYWIVLRIFTNLTDSWWDRHPMLHPILTLQKKILCCAPIFGNKKWQIKPLKKLQYCTPFLVSIKTRAACGMNCLGWTCLLYGWQKY